MKSTSAWLIEREDVEHPGCVTGACLGITDAGKIRGLNWRVCWTTPAFALRFSRKEDAEAAMQVLGPCVPKRAVEHLWEEG